MPYDAKDPRSQLGGTQTKERPAAACFAPQYFEFGKLEPDDVSDAGTRSWYVRSQNCCVVFSDGVEGDMLERADQPDEYMVLFPGDARATVSAGSRARPKSLARAWWSSPRDRARSRSAPRER